MKLNIFSDLRKPGLVPGKSLSLFQNYVFCFGENLIYIDHLNSYISGQLLSIRRNMYTTNLDKTTCLKIKELGLKRMFRETRGGKNKPKQRST